jgi:hypothetical protein
MDEKRVPISRASGWRTGHVAIPDDLRDEIFRSQVHIDGERLRSYQSLTGIAQLPGVDPGEEATIYAIEDLRESYSKEPIHTRNLNDSLGSSRREGC